MARDAFRYLMSFAGEQVVGQYSSDINPVIEVALVNGRYQLNAENVNYSYGPLHYAFRRYFHVDPPNLGNDDQILILGFGGGSVAVILREEMGFANPIVGVEIDEMVLKAAREHFNIDRLADTKIIQQDAQTFAANSTEKYKLIVVDIYLDQFVPKVFEKPEFIEQLKNILVEGGKLVFNKFVGTPELYAEAKALEEVFNSIFGSTQVFKIPVNKQKPNLMITGLKSQVAELAGEEAE